MQVTTLVEAICAMHLGSYVEGPFTERGGLMLVGAPGALKTTLAAVLDRQYFDAVLLSDINARTLADIRDQVATRAIRTLVLPELAKIYERHPSTASNVEGTLRALAGEGFQAASFEDQRVNRIKAHATIIGAMPPKFQSKHFTDWEDSGFNRRFLWALFSIADPEVLEHAVENWRLADLTGISHVPRAPLTGESIPNSTTAAERRECRLLVKYQPGGTHITQQIILVRMLAVLRWWYDQAGIDRDAMESIREFAEALGKGGAEVVLQPHRKRTNGGVHAAGRRLARERWTKKGRRK